MFQWIKCLFDKHDWELKKVDATYGGFPGYNWIIMECKYCFRARKLTSTEREEI